METGSPQDTGPTGTEGAAGTPGAAEAQSAAKAVGSTADAVEDAAQAVEGAAEAVEDGPVWIALPPGLLKMRRLLLVVWLGLISLAAGLVPGLLAGPAWAAFALPPLALMAWGWVLIGRNWRSWRYAERADDLLISRGVLWREETVVPYGRMQLVEVTSGPVERHFGLASVQLHTAAAATDATIPGLDPAEAERLRDRLTELGEARSAGL
ncbi:PH domain-containing protein [Streptomyces sp. NPDC050416]|uniref:PH domain-containing protein n=1 Tax=Streptomyces sp. NPDC050416 TaxID=3365611 RepID=UPI0037989E39